MRKIIGPAIMAVSGGLNTAYAWKYSGWLALSCGLFAAAAIIWADLAERRAP